MAPDASLQRADGRGCQSGALSQCLLAEACSFSVSAQQLAQVGDDCGLSSGGINALSVSQTVREVYDKRRWHHGLAS
jgi:hypothetical protein